MLNKMSSPLIKVFLISSSQKKAHTAIINEPFCSYKFLAPLLEAIIILKHSICKERVFIS
jgi:hypothetical protein